MRRTLSAHAHFEEFADDRLGIHTRLDGLSDLEELRKLLLLLLLQLGLALLRRLVALLDSAL